MEREENSKTEIQPKKHRVLIVFGPSQFGKSTFICNMMKFANCTSEQPHVGDGSGESVTVSVNFYDIGVIPAMFPNDRINYDTLTIIDVPGVFDSGLRISNEEIIQSIQKNLLERNVSELDAIILFESMQDDARKINHTMGFAVRLFGDICRSSTIVLSTKWDRVQKSKLKIKEDYFETLIKKLFVTTMKWKNNVVEDDLVVSDDEMNRQLSELGCRILKLKKYYVDGMNELMLRRDRIAEELRANDPNRFSTEEKTIPIKRPIESKRTMQIPSVELVPLTESEIEAKAQIMFNCQPPSTKIMVPSGKRRTRKPRKIPIWKSDSYNFETGMIFKDKHSVPYMRFDGYIDDPEDTDLDMGPELIEQDSPKVSLDFFKAQLRGESKIIPVQKTIEIDYVEMVDDVKTISINHELHTFDHYQKLALEQMEKEFIQSVR